MGVVTAALHNFGAADAPFVGLRLADHSCASRNNPFPKTGLVNAVPLSILCCIATI
jgi:hypothetical protein